MHKLFDSQVAVLRLGIKLVEPDLPLLFPADPLCIHVLLAPLIFKELLRLTFLLPLLLKHLVHYLGQVTRCIELLDFGPLLHDRVLEHYSELVFPQLLTVEFHATALIVVEDVVEGHWVLRLVKLHPDFLLGFFHIVASLDQSSELLVGQDEA